LGIKNVTERLKLLYGDDYKLTMGENESRTEYAVQLELPIKM